MAGNPYDAIVLAGGGSRRFGGRDKAMMRVGNKTLLEIAVAAVAGAQAIVVVGPRRQLSADVKWMQESQPGAGPAHALAAAIGMVSAPLVAVLACDLPFAGADVIGRLMALAGGADGAVVRDRFLVPQPLFGVYKTVSLRSSLQRAATADASMGAVTSTLRLAYVNDDMAAVDCDTPEALRRALATAAQLDRNTSQEPHRNYE